MDVNFNRRVEDRPYSGPLLWYDKRDTLCGDISRKGNVALDVVIEKVEEFFSTALDTIKKTLSTISSDEATNQLVSKSDPTSLNGLAVLVAIHALDDAWRTTCSIQTADYLTVVLEKARDCFREHATVCAKELSSIRLDSDIEAQLNELRHANIHAMGCVLDCVVRNPPRA